MKFLHTADWHLGQKFLFYDREREHRLALHWLTEQIRERQIDALIVAGDVFDIGNPPNYARKLYYQFLTGLLNSPCRHVIITGGNHDSPSMLNAPRELLEALNVHVIGSATENPEDEIIILKNEEKQAEAVIAAVPFLRDRDLKSSIAGESSQERIERIKEGIYRHYQEVGDLAKKYENLGIPILATGHLYAKGAQAAEKQDNIYIGNMENIAAEQFPEVFDYVALGHLHRPQKVGGKAHIRYSGSIIPLSFSEILDTKSVALIEFDGKKIETVETISLPVFRKLSTLKGSLENIQSKLDHLAQELKDQELPAWVEVIIETDKLIPNVDVLLKEYAKDMNLELLKIRTNRQHYALDTQTETMDLDNLDPIDVFKKKCESFGSPPEEMEELVATFEELKSWMQEEEEKE